MLFRVGHPAIAAGRKDVADPVAVLVGGRRVHDSTELLGSPRMKELVREMKLQLIEKDAKIQAMESQCASLKRSSVIQAVELQELHDHLAGLEKQKNLQEIQRFPPLPPLSSIKESPYEHYEDEDGKMRAIMLADEALHNAQQEIAILKQSDERRQQLEGLLNNANKELATLRESLAAAQQGRGRYSGACFVMCLHRCVCSCPLILRVYLYIHIDMCLNIQHNLRTCT